MTVSAIEYDAQHVLAYLNDVALGRGGAPQSARFSSGPSPYSCSNWWLDPLVWMADGLTLCAFADFDETDLYIAAWGDGAEPVISTIEAFLVEHYESSPPVRSDPWLPDTPRRRPSSRPRVAQAMTPVDLALPGSRSPRYTWSGLS